jgi:hypothetical protein
LIRGVGAAAVACATLAVAAPSAASAPTASASPSVLVLPAPVTKLPTFPNIGLRPDRRLVSQVPGTVVTREDVTVGVDGGGNPVDVQLDEHLRLSGTGPYLIYERGPARKARPIDNSLAPVLKLGTVLWQGFSPGSRELAAHLELDAGLEAERLPVTVQLYWRPRGATTAQPLGANGVVPGAGTVELRLSNATGTPRAVPTGLASPPPLASALSTLQAAAQRSSAQPTTALALPTAGRGLPRQLPATDVGQMLANVVAPMRVVGTLTAPGTTARLAGPTVASVAGGGHFNGVLTDTVGFALTVPGPTRVALDVTATPTLDERTLQPPHGTWNAWARSGPSAAEVRRATDQLVAGAAASARVAELSPYIGTDTTGPATTRFRYAMSAAARVAPKATPLHPRPLPIALVALAGLVVVSGAAVVWRRS